jgi:heme A synthase
LLARRHSVLLWIIRTMGRSVARRREHPRWKAGALSLVYSAAGVGIAAVIVALTGIAPWIAVLVATVILVIWSLARERL